MLLTLITMLVLNLSAVDKERLVKHDIDNLLEWQAEVNIASKRYDVPEWIIAGVLFNESNFRAVVRGGQYGHGQINCKIWLPKLRQNGIAHSCKDLLHPWVSIHSAAFILNHLKTQKRSVKKGTVDWRAVLTYYRRGVRWKAVDSGYYNRVYFYGKNIRSFWPTRKIKWCSI